MPFQDLSGLLCPLHPTLESVEQNQCPTGHLSVESHQALQAPRLDARATLGGRGFSIPSGAICRALLREAEILTAPHEHKRKGQKGGAYRPLRRGECCTVLTYGPYS